MSGQPQRPKVTQLKPTRKAIVVDGEAPPAPPRPVASSSRATAQQHPSSRQSGPARTGPRIVTGQGGGQAVLVNSCQTGNPILTHIRNVPWEYADIVPDYQVGVASCILFLSLKYHRLHPEYIHTRIEKLAQMYTLRLLLVMCDVENHQAAIRELTKVALVNNLTIMIAWTPEEAGRYIETYKAFEHKPPDLIKGRVGDDYMSHLSSALTSIRSVNKTDVVTLASNFGSLKRIAETTGEELGGLPGFGDVKIKRLREAFHQPFRIGETRTWRERREVRSKAAAQSAATEAASARAAAPARNNDIDLDDFEQLDEEEQLRLALAMSEQVDEEVELG